MPEKLNVLSYHLLLETNNNRLPTRVDKSEIRAIKKADAVILPQGCKKELYEAARTHCPHVFPNYDAFFQYPGKTGQITLFQKFRVHHPATLVFNDLASFEKNAASFSPSFPLVCKFSWGGEGKNVFLLEKTDDLTASLELAKKYEDAGKRGFILQEYIPARGRSLRVVVMADKFVSYWRCHRNGEGFYSNLARGAIIDRDFRPGMQEAAIRELKKFCGLTKINLAGFDFLFADDDNPPTPLFLEINYFFRCHGLGGPDGYLELLTQAVREWLKRI